MRATRLRVGLLVNFSSPVRVAVERMVL
ncbi:hypothetical protein [Phenylobacterium sp. J367]|nr:hypothetical protein [Phenylobacterium sp. J367]